MTGPRLDFTINLGHLLSISAVIVTMVAGWVNFDARLKAVETTLATSTQTFIKQIELGADLRALDARVVRIERLLEGAPR